MNSYDLAEIWVRCKDKLKESFNEKVFNVWIKPIMPLEVTDTYYKVAVKNDFFKTMLEENYAQVIEGVLAGIMSKNIKLIIETMDNGSSDNSPAEELPAVPTKREQQQLFNEKASELSKNGAYTYEEAQSIAAEIVAKPGTSDHQTGLAVDILDKDAGAYDLIGVELFISIYCHSVIVVTGNSRSVYFSSETLSDD